MALKKPVVFRVNNNLDIGGITSRLHHMLPLLQEEFDVHVVTYRKAGELVGAFRDLGIGVHHVPLSGKWSPSGLYRLARLFREHKADIVHTHSFGGNVSGILAASMARVPVRLGQVHTRNQHWYGKTALHRKKQCFEEYCIHSLLSDRVLFPSQAALDYFVSHCPVRAEKLHILYNGIRLPNAADAEAAAGIRAQYGISAHRKILGFVGRLAVGKGLDFAFHFMGRLRGAGLDHCLMVVGSSGRAERDEALKQKAESFGKDLIYFTGQQASPYAFYRAFDGLFFPSESWTEAMPGSVLEAAAHGLPILSRENPAVREVARFYSGIHSMADDDDPGEAVARLFAMPPADISLFVKNFSVQAMAEQTIKLYHTLLAEKNG